MDHFINALIAFVAIIGVATFVIGPIVFVSVIERTNARLANFIGFGWVLVLLFTLCFLVTN